jgi:hypothetical protein
MLQRSVRPPARPTRLLRGRRETGTAAAGPAGCDCCTEDVQQHRVTRRRSLGMLGRLQLLLLAAAVGQGDGSSASSAGMTYACRNATDQPAAPNLLFLSNLSTSAACGALCTANPRCVGYVVADCTAAGGWLGQCGGAKPCDVPKGRLDCWLKSATTPELASGCRRICTNNRAPAPAPPSPPPAPVRKYMCTHEGRCVAGVGHVSFTDPNCFNQCNASAPHPAATTEDRARAR